MTHARAGGGDGRRVKALLEVGHGRLGRDDLHGGALRGTRHGVGQSLGGGVGGGRSPVCGLGVGHAGEGREHERAEDGEAGHGCFLKAFS